MRVVAGIYFLTILLAITVFFFFLVFKALAEAAPRREAGGRLGPSVQRGHSRSIPFLWGGKERLMVRVGFEGEKNKMHSEKRERERDINSGSGKGGGNPAFPTERTREALQTAGTGL